MTPNVAASLLVATLTAMGSILALLMTFDRQEEDLAPEYQEVKDHERAALAWEWRLGMASLPELYWSLPFTEG